MIVRHVDHMKVSKNTNGRPVLNKNTVRQAEKPRNKPVSLPAADFLPSFRDVEKLETELYNKNRHIEVLQKQLLYLSNQLDEARQRAAKK